MQVTSGTVTLSLQEHKVLTLCGVSAVPTDVIALVAELDRVIDFSAESMTSAIDGGKLRLLETIRNRAAAAAGVPTRRAVAMRPYDATRAAAAPRQ